jgi:HK97 family phage prohead protease
MMLDLIQQMSGGAVQHRAAEIRDADTKEGVLTVLVAPYGRRTRLLPNVTEEFAAGCFARSVKSPHRLSVFHEHGGPLVGRGFEAEDLPDGFLVRSKIGSTLAAREMLSLIEDRILTDASVEFRPIQRHMKVEQHGDSYDITHRQADLTGYAMVSEGAYTGTKVLSLRDFESGRAREELQAWLAAERAKTFTE